MLDLHFRIEIQTKTKEFEEIVKDMKENEATLLENIDALEKHSK